jgi:galactokinase
VLDRKIEALCELEVFEFEKIKTIWEDSLIQNRVKHCVYENDRVKKAVTALENNDLSELGQLLCQSHESLRDNYEVTGIELDSLYEEAIKNEGCLGARMTGAGFGGCAIALVHTDFIDRFISNVGEAYTLKTGLCATFFACMAGDGVSKLI